VSAPFDPAKLLVGIPVNGSTVIESEGDIELHGELTLNLQLRTVWTRPGFVLTGLRVAGYPAPFLFQGVNDGGWCRYRVNGDVGVMGMLGHRVHVNMRNKGQPCIAAATLQGEPIT
jgi:hypothetical protein